MSSVIQIQDAELATEVLNSEQPVLLYFWAGWCGPCKLMSPVVDWAAQAYGGLKVAKIEVDPNPTAVKQYQVEGVPALRLVQGTEILAASEGAIGKQKLASLLDPHLTEA